MTCTLCGGNHGTMPDGRHNLCAARAELGLPTPSLGTACAACAGRGWKRDTPLPAVLPVYFNPSDLARGVRAIFPPCQACKGKGYN